MSYYLVQRLTVRDNAPADAIGFDTLFSLDYMGSSEFEWGAIPAALKSMRRKRVSAKPFSVVIDGQARDVYMVGESNQLIQAAANLQKWASGPRPFDSKEATGFAEAFAGEKTWRDTNAWWAIQEDIAFTLDAGIADRLVAAFNNGPAKAPEPPDA